MILRLTWFDSASGPIPLTGKYSTLLESAFARTQVSGRAESYAADIGTLDDEKALTLTEPGEPSEVYTSFWDLSRMP